MENRLVLAGSAVVPQGREILVEERPDAEGRSRVVSVTDAAAGVTYRWEAEPGGPSSRWSAVVVSCTVTTNGTQQRTVLVVDSVAESASAPARVVASVAVDAEQALREADAAVDAARAEAYRWGGADRTPPKQQPRFW